MISPSRTTRLFAALALTCLPRSAEAQTARTLDVSAAYAYVRDPQADVNFPAGWSVGVSASVREWLSLVGAYDDSRKTISTIAGDLSLGVKAVMAGGKASATLGRATQFGQLLFGIVRVSSSAFGVSEASTNFGAQAGGGVDYPLAHRVALRGEVDYRIIAGRGTALGRQFRTLAGVVLTVF